MQKPTLNIDTKIQLISSCLGTNGVEACLHSQPSAILRCMLGAFLSKQTAAKPLCFRYHLLSQTLAACLWSRFVRPVLKMEHIKMPPLHNRCQRDITHLLGQCGTLLFEVWHIPFPCRLGQMATIFRYLIRTFTTFLKFQNISMSNYRYTFDRNVDKCSCISGLCLKAWTYWLNSFGDTSQHWYTD